jgi:hypothetical protein
MGVCGLKLDQLSKILNEVVNDCGQAVRQCELVWGTGQLDMIQGKRMRPGQ